MEKELRENLRKVVNWGEAHTEWKKAIDGVSKAKRGVRPPSSPHSAWELLEHMRIAQWDILDFCTNPKHSSPKWPEGYWPKSPAPPSDDAWGQSVEQFEKDNKALGDLARSPAARRSQFVSPGAICVGAPASGRLAERIGARFLGGWLTRYNISINLRGDS
jgi:hypothetical protein